MNVAALIWVKPAIEGAYDWMKKLLARVLALTFGALACFAGTNSPALRHWFSLPSQSLRPLMPPSEAADASLGDHIRTEASSPRRSQTASTMLLTNQMPDANTQDWISSLELPVTNAPAERLALSSSLAESDLRTYRMLEANGYFTRPPEKSDNPLVRVAAGIFEPTPVRVGKTTVSCSVITAIKKRNPLCLLNPMVLSISW